MNTPYPQGTQKTREMRGLLVPYRQRGSWEAVDFTRYEHARTDGLEQCVGVATWPKGTLAHLTPQTNLDDYFAWLAHAVHAPQKQRVFLAGGRAPDSEEMIKEIRKQLTGCRFTLSTSDTCEDDERYTGRDMILHADGRVEVFPYNTMRRPGNNSPEKIYCCRKILV